MSIADQFDGTDTLIARVRALQGTRSIIAVAGPPGAGKSTLAHLLAETLNDTEPGSAAVVPMDGFHYDDAILTAWGSRARKGAPDTFDVGGFKALLGRLRANEELFVAIPVFDRALEISRAGGAVVPSSVRYLIVEGNYLLLDAAPWSALAPFFDFTAMVREDRAVLERRLMDRWLTHGFSAEAARIKVASNDLPNADLVLAQSRPAQFTLCARP